MFAWLLDSSNRVEWDRLLEEVHQNGLSACWLYINQLAVVYTDCLVILELVKVHNRLPLKPARGLFSNWAKGAMPVWLTVSLTGNERSHQLSSGKPASFCKGAKFMRRQNVKT
jgi:hypothetical protein